MTVNSHEQEFSKKRLVIMKQLQKKLASFSYFQFLELPVHYILGERGSEKVSPCHSFFSAHRTSANYQKDFFRILRSDKTIKKLITQYSDYYFIAKKN